MTGMNFRKKPVVIQAIQWTGRNQSEISEFATVNACFFDQVDSDGSNRKIDANLEIATIEGNLTASVGDWIIKGIKGEFYPCKPDIFEATYEAVP
jgi:hypothetical protein